MMSMVKALALAAVVVVGTFSGTPAHAEPTSGRVKIYQVRPYMPGTVFFTTTPAAICNTFRFMIDLAASGGKEIYSAVLAAQLAGKSVYIEVSNSTGCTGASTGASILVQSVTVVPD
jgi:hypothetical protein